jgi:ABC-2 type transport system ATP-binding protein
MAGDVDGLRSAHVLLRGARSGGGGERDQGVPAEPAARTVVECRAGDRQVTALIRPDGRRRPTAPA